MAAFVSAAEPIEPIPDTSPSERVVADVQAMGAPAADAERVRDSVPLWFHTFALAPGVYTPGIARDTYFIDGQVLAPITPVNKLIYPPATFSLKFAQSAGVQNPGLYQGSGPITLTTSLTPYRHEELVEAPEQTGFAFSSPLTFSEPLEIDD